MIIDPGLLNHINHRLNDHESVEAIRHSLLSVGWDQNQIEAALNEVAEARTNTSEQTKGNPEIFMLKHRHNDQSALTGRLSVRQYLVGVLLIGLIDLVALFGLYQGYRVLPPTPEIETLFFTAFLALVLLNVFTLISITVRRLHDIGYENTWALLLFVPLVNIIFLIFLCKPGMHGKNVFGEDPRFFDVMRTLLNR